MAYDNMCHCNLYLEYSEHLMSSETRIDESEAIVAHRRQLGARLFAEANNLKRTAEALAAELGMNPETIRGVFAGEEDLRVARQLLDAMMEAYPISLSDVWVDGPDTHGGVVVMRAADSSRSSRVFVRKSRAGVSKPYMEYKDTAMSRLAPFRPETVRPLHVVEDDDPDNITLAYNNGHLLHQLTFFVGDVNAYWITSGRRSSVRLVTGDSTYMAPYVAHSFASRNSEALGLTIAVTYHGELQPALPALGRIEPSVALDLCGDLRNPASAFRAILMRYASAESVSADSLSDMLTVPGIMSARRAAQIVRGDEVPSADEVRHIADVIGVRPTELLICPLEPSEEVVVRRAAETKERPFPDSSHVAALLRPLARTRHQPGLRGFAMKVIGDADTASRFRHHLHEYAYNYGDRPVRLVWQGGRDTIMEPGDSAYIEPTISHGFGFCGRPADLLIIRVPGTLTDAAFRELSGYGSDRERAVVEFRQWF